MRSTAEGMLPIRIGAYVPDGVALCEGCRPEDHSQEPHVQPFSRFTLLVWMPVNKATEDIPPGQPFVGGIHTPPALISTVHASSHPALAQFVRILHCN